MTAADSRCSRRRSAGGDGGTTLFRSVRSDEDGGNQRTSQRAERAIKHSAMREQLKKGAALIVAVAGPRVEPPDVCRKGPRRAAGTQELHAGKYLGSNHKDQGDPEQNSRAGRPASRVAARHAAQECGERHRVRGQVRNPGEPLLTLQILCALAEPGGHGPPPDGDLNDTDGQHENRRDERSNRPSQTGPSIAERREDGDRCRRSYDRQQTTCCPDLGQSQVRRHSSRNGRLCGGPVRSDLPRRVLIVAHARSLRPWGAHQLRATEMRAICKRAIRMRAAAPDKGAASVGNRAPAVLRRRERRRSFLCERRRSRRISSARCASSSRQGD